MIGQTLSHYQIVGRLGAGGMGEVFLAEDTKLGREVAIKILLETSARNPDWLTRFPDGQQFAMIKSSEPDPEPIQLYVGLGWFVELTRSPSAQ